MTEEERAAKPVKVPGKGVRPIISDVDAATALLNVPDDETLNQKMYYRISVVAKWFGVNNSLIRYWENEFDILKPRLTRKGDRLFRVEDVKNLQLIYQLLKVRKFSVEGAKKYLNQNKQKADAHLELTESLTKIRTFLSDLKATLGQQY
jgi:DNA-binding transcriptional MerR regulator